MKLTVRDCFVMFREKHNLVWCDSPKDVKMYESMDRQHGARAAFVLLGLGTVAPSSRTSDPASIMT